MRTWTCIRFAAALLVALALSVWGGVVTGTFTRPDGAAYTNAVVFRPLSTPGVVGGSVVTTVPIQATTTTNGTIAAELVAGRYQVSASGTTAFTIEVPEGTGTNDIADLVVSGAPVLDTYGWTAIRVDTNGAVIIPTNFWSAASNSVVALVNVPSLGSYTNLAAEVPWTLPNEYGDEGSIWVEDGSGGFSVIGTTGWMRSRLSDTYTSEGDYIRREASKTNSLIFEPTPAAPAAVLGEAPMYGRTNMSGSRVSLHTTGLRGDAARLSTTDDGPVNILDYGADPTGVSDSGPAIQSALAVGTGVYCPRGTYLVGALITGAVNLVVTGDPGATWFTHSGSYGSKTRNWFSIDTATNVVLRNVGFIEGTAVMYSGAAGITANIATITVDGVRMQSLLEGLFYSVGTDYTYGVDSIVVTGMDARASSSYSSLAGTYGVNIKSLRVNKFACRQSRFENIAEAVTSGISDDNTASVNHFDVEDCQFVNVEQGAKGGSKRTVNVRQVMPAAEMSSSVRRCVFGPSVPLYSQFSAVSNVVTHRATTLKTNATLTIGSHEFVSGQYVTVSAVPESKYNIVAVLTGVTPTTISYALATPLAADEDVDSSGVATMLQVTYHSAVYANAYDHAVVSDCTFKDWGVPSYNSAQSETLAVKLSLAITKPRIPLATRARSGGTATITTTIAHGFTNGASVEVSGSGSAAYDAIWTLTGVGTYTFSFALAGTETTTACKSYGTAREFVRSGQGVTVERCSFTDTTTNSTGSMTLQGGARFIDCHWLGTKATNVVTTSAAAGAVSSVLFERCRWENVSGAPVFSFTAIDPSAAIEFRGCVLTNVAAFNSVNYVFTMSATSTNRLFAAEDCEISLANPANVWFVQQGPAPVMTRFERCRSNAQLLRWSTAGSGSHAVRMIGNKVSWTGAQVFYIADTAVPYPLIWSGNEYSTTYGISGDALNTFYQWLGTDVLAYNGAPESALTAKPGTLALSTINGVARPMIKLSGSGSTGWSSLGLAPTITIASSSSTAHGDSGLLLNGSFSDAAPSTSCWLTNSATWALTNSQAEHSSDGGRYLWQTNGVNGSGWNYNTNLTLVAGRTYTAKWTNTTPSPGATFFIHLGGNATYGTALSVGGMTTGFYSRHITASATTSNSFAFYAGTWVGSVDDASLWENLGSSTIASGSLGANGNAFVARYSGTFANNANNKRLYCVLHNDSASTSHGTDTTIFDTGSAAFGSSAAAGWDAEVIVVRTGTTTGTAFVRWTCSDSAKSSSYSVTALTGQTWASDTIAVDVQVGESHAVGDIVLNLIQTRYDL